MLTISRLSRWSINYYNDTALQAAQAGLDRRRANGGLGEYYSEGDTRAPSWLLAGDAARTVKLVGLDGRAAAGGIADPDIVRRWLDDGIAPNGAVGRAFTKGSVHGFDLTFAASKSVSLLRALTDDIAEKAMQACNLVHGSVDRPTAATLEARNAILTSFVMDLLDAVIFRRLPDPD
jgi:hypothetical protein